MNKGYSYAYASVMLWAMFNIIAKISVSFDISPSIYVAIGSLAASAVLFMQAGPGHLSYSTLKQPRTFIYSGLNLLEHIFTLHLFVYVAGTEGSLMQRVNVALGLLIALLFMHRKPKWNDLLGVSIIIAGVGLMIASVDPSIRAPAMVWLGLAILCQTIKTFIAETHPENNKAVTFADQARVTAFITFITSVTFIIILLIMCVIKETGALAPSLTEVFPSFKDFIHPVTFIAGLIFGVLNEAPASYCYFYAAKKIKAEKFLMITILVPILTFTMEYPLSKMGIISIRDLNTNDLIAISLIITGFVVMHLLNRSNKVKFTTKEQRELKAVKAKVMMALNYFKGDMDKTAKALNVNSTTITNILEGKKAYKPTTFNRIHDSYSDNVASKDPITGLQNRATLEIALQQAEAKGVDFTLFFLDLNKFKPINDTYGHEVGDLALKEIGSRFIKKYNHVAELCRWGGDEFVIVFYKTDKEKSEKYYYDLLRLIAEPMDLEGVDDILEVSASIGYAHSSEAANVLDLAGIADKDMYKDKDSR